jgi:hypothetical protein
VKDVVCSLYALTQFVYISSVSGSSKGKTDANQ